MTISAALVGRDLHITVAGIEEPFVIKPLPGLPGRQITETYLNGAVGISTADQITDALAIAVDGGVLDGETWIPRPLAERVNGNRMGIELSIAETESVALASFFWQTVLNMAGVNAYIEGGEGLAGGVKALWALVARLGISPTTIAPSTALETLIQLQAPTRPTSTPRGGAKPGKQPQDRRSKRTPPRPGPPPTTSGS